MSTSESLKPLVLVTGGSGFLGAHIVAQLLDAGYRVRCMARGPKARFLETAHASRGSQFTIVEVQDLENADLGEALEGIEAVVHVAFPAPGSMDSIDLLLNGVNATTNLLRQAYERGIFKFVLTSSYLAVIGTQPDSVWRDYTFTDKDWNDATYEGVFDGSRDPSWLYSAAKKLAEAAAWEFARSHPQVDLATVAPTVLLGPVAPGHAILSMADLSTNILLHTLLFPEGSPPHPIWPHFVDVRDAARMHLLALQMPARSLPPISHLPSTASLTSDGTTPPFTDENFLSPGPSSLPSPTGEGLPLKRFLASGASFTWGEALSHLRPGRSTFQQVALPAQVARLDVRWTGGEGPYVAWRDWRETVDDAVQDLDQVAERLERSGWEDISEDEGLGEDAE